MKNISIILFLIALNVQAQWTYVGERLFSENYANFLNIKINPVTHEPWAAFRDQQYYSKVSVMRFDGVKWHFVGTPGFSDDVAECVSLAFTKEGIPYVAFADVSMGWATTVMRFKNNKWELVGPKGLSGGAASFQSIDIDSSGTPFVAFRDMSLESNTKAHAGTSVLKFNGTDWEYLGQKAFVTHDYYGGPFNLSLKLDKKSTPYIAYQNMSNGWALYVQRFNGSEWETVGPVNFGGWCATFSRSMAFDSKNRPYIVCRDSGRTTAMRYENGQWNGLGTPLTSQGGSEYASIVIDNYDTPYIAFQDYGVTRELSVMKFADEKWQYLGEQGCSPSSVQYVSIDVDHTGKVYVAFNEKIDPSTTGGWRASAMVFQGKTVGVAKGKAGINGDFKVFPNPAENSVHITYNGLESGIQINVTNLTGQCIKTFHYSSASSVSETFDTSGLCKGVYFMELVTSQGREVKKLVVD